MTLNTIKTNEEYLAEGFTVAELPLIRRHDELFNKYALGTITDTENEELDALVEELGL